MADTCQAPIPIETLIDYADGNELDPIERIQIQQHLEVCSFCRGRLMSEHDVDQLLEGYYATCLPPIDSPASCAQIMQRIQRQREENTASASEKRPLASWVTIAAALALIAVVLVGVIYHPAASAATNGIERFVRLVVLDVDEGPSSLPGNSELPGESLMQSSGQPLTDDHELSFNYVAPEVLPLGLRLTQATVESPEFLELWFESEQGLTLWLGESPLRGPIASAPPDSSVIRIRGVDVVWVEDPVTGDVGRLLWERNGIVFEILVGGTAIGEFPIHRATLVVENIIEAQG